MKWQDTLIDLVILEQTKCESEQSCYLNNILSFVEKQIDKSHLKGFNDGADATATIALECYAIESAERINKILDELEKAKDIKEVKRIIKLHRVKPQRQ